MQRHACRQPRLDGVLAAIATAWLVVIIVDIAGHADAFDHGQLSAHRVSSVALGVCGWQLMTLAMMGPSTLPLARYVAANTLVPTRAVSAFFLGYLVAWTAFFAEFALLDASAHAALGTAGTVRGAWIVTGLAAAVAAAWQLTPAKRGALRACRAVGVPPAHGLRASVAALRLGVRQGLACVLSCGPVMLVALAVPGGRLLLMASIAVLAWLEKATRWSRRVTRPSAVLLGATASVCIAAGLWVTTTPGASPPTSASFRRTGSSLVVADLGVASIRDRAVAHGELQPPWATLWPRCHEAWSIERVQGFGAALVGHLSNPTPAKQVLIGVKP